MTCSLSTELEQQLKLRAAACQMSVEQVVEQAIEAYLATPPQANEPNDKDIWLNNFQQLQRSLNLTPEKAEAWKQAIMDARR
jgi:hypothetical protein